MLLHAQHDALLMLFAQLFCRTWWRSTWLRCASASRIDPALARFDAVTRLLTGRLLAQAADGVAWLHEFCQVLAVPRLAASGLTHEHLAGLIGKAVVAHSMKGNPISLRKTSYGNL